jgi:pyruvate kinase
VACSELRVQRQLQLSWGVRPFVMPLCDNVEELIEGAVDYLKKSKSIKAKDKVIIITGEPVGISGNVNLIEIKDIQK